MYWREKHVSGAEEDLFCPGACTYESSLANKSIFIRLHLAFMYVCTWCKPLIFPTFIIAPHGLKTPKPDLEMILAFNVFTNYWSKSPQKIGKDAIKCLRKSCPHANVSLLLATKCFTEPERLASD